MLRVHKYIQDILIENFLSLCEDYYHRMGPLGRFGLVVVMSVCIRQRRLCSLKLPYLTRFEVSLNYLKDIISGVLQKKLCSLCFCIYFSISKSYTALIRFRQLPLTNSMLYFITQSIEFALNNPCT